MTARARHRAVCPCANFIRRFSSRAAIAKQLPIGTFFVDCVIAFIRRFMNFTFNPLLDICRAVRNVDASRFATRCKTNYIAIHESDLFQIQS